MQFAKISRNLGGKKNPKPNQENLAVLANGCSKQTSGFLGFHRVMYY